MNKKYKEPEYDIVNGRTTKLRPKKQIKQSTHFKYLWAWNKLREWLKSNCVDIETQKLGDLKYCLRKYFEVLGRNKVSGKAQQVLFREYNNKDSPIYKGIRVEGLTLKKKPRRERKVKYRAYLKSLKWREFKNGIIKERGEVCELCKSKTNKLDLHHKTYARLFNELPSDVLLLCRDCHNQQHEPLS